MSFLEFSYIPSLRVRPSEINALAHLPGASRDLILPVLQLRKWRRRQDLGSSLEQVARAIGTRRFVMDLCPQSDGDDEIEAEVRTLHRPNNGFVAWRTWVASTANAIPLVLRSGNETQVRSQMDAFLQDGPIAIRVRREDSWDNENLGGLADIETQDAEILGLIECGQITRTGDLNFMAMEARDAIDALRSLAPDADWRFALSASSFPSNFSTIDPRRARLRIRERELHELVAASLGSDAGLLTYGDRGSVYAGEPNTVQRRGAPRVDLPSRRAWVYARRAEGFQEAAQAVMQESDWDDELMLWGTNEIRRAATGDLEKLRAPQMWTAVRVHLHLYQQTHSGESRGEFLDTEEEWTD